MLTGNLVRVRVQKGRVVPLYLAADDPEWLDVAEGLLMIYRAAQGMTRGEIGAEIQELVGDGAASLAQQGLAKVLEDRAEFEVVAEVAPDALRAAAFAAAADHRRALADAGRGARFDRDAVLRGVAEQFGLQPNDVVASLFADLKDENRMLGFDDTTAPRLVERYNVALAQSVLLRSVTIRVQVRGERPARYRQLFRALKFHRLIARVAGNMTEGYTLAIDGPMSLFSSTTKYGLQMALFLPALLHCADFRLDAELRWGPRREPRTFFLSTADGLVSHTSDAPAYVPAEIAAFVDRFRQVAPGWEVSEATEILPLGRDDVWVPDYRFAHRATGTDVFVEILGFWRRGAVERLLRLLPQHGPPRYALVISDKLKVDEGALGELAGPILRFKEIPNAPEMAALLNQFLPERGPFGLL